jgi:hypothetical protein
MTAPTYFISWKGRRDGPYSVEQLADLLQRGEISLLHRVETGQGSVPLRQVLQNSEGGRWTHFLTGTAAPSASTSGPEGISSDGVVAQTVSTAGAVASVTKPRNTGVVDMLAEFLGADPADPAFASRAYTLCGLSFILPPLGWFVFQLAGTLVARGCVELGHRIRLLTLMLAVAGCIFWGLLIKFL